MAPPTLRSGPWDLARVTAHLTSATIPLRLATAGTHPMVQSLWFTFDDDALWCATQEDSLAVKRIRRHGNVGFEIAADTPPYAGVRGTGHATIDRDRGQQVLATLIERYLGPESTPLGQWLMSRADDEVAIRIEGLALTSWDYSARM